MKTVGEAKYLKTLLRKKWGIKTISFGKEIPADCLWVTRCSKIKSKAIKGKPKDLYCSYINKYFYKHMEKRGLPYGVISDKYGLHLSDEKLPSYDIHPSLLTSYDKMRLGKIIKWKCNKRGFKRIIFYNNSPLMSFPYFEILFYSNLEVFFITNLDI